MYTEINFIWIIDWSIKGETKNLKHNISLQYLGVLQTFLNRAQKSNQHNEKKWEMQYITTKNFSSKYNIRKAKKGTRIVENICS